MSLLTTLNLPAQGERISVRTQLFSASNSYLVEKIVGQGTFGTVAKCKRSSDKQTVAIKMVKEKGDLKWQSRAEVQILQKLSTLDSDKCNLVRWYSAFINRGYFCLEFESLDKSLHDLMKERNFQPLLLKEIRPIVQQLSNALLHLKRVNIIHADLKLENVMLVNQSCEPFKIKVIDFGLACDTSSARVGALIQTLYYRSPEIILGLPFTEAVDMWSVGCIAAYLYLGSLLYVGYTEYDMMRCIVETQGQLPDSQLSDGCKTHIFFNKDSNRNTWKLKSPEEVRRSTGSRPVDIRDFKLRSLEEISRARQLSSYYNADRAAEKIDLRTFVEMLKGMLHLEGSMRLTPQQALNHPFIRMGHLRRESRFYYQSCIRRMAVCPSKSSAPVNAEGCSQQPRPGMDRPVQQNRPAVGGCPQMPRPGITKPFQQIRPAEGGHLQKPQPRTAKPVLQNLPTKAVQKRKADDGDLSLTETPHQSKRAKHENSVQPCKETGADCSSNSSALVRDRERSQQPPSKTAKPVQQIQRAEGGHLQKAQPRTTKPFQQIRPAEGGHLQKPQPRTAKPVLQNVPTKAGLKRKADDGDLSLTETPHQSKPAKHESSVQPCKETGADCSSNSSALVRDRERSQQPPSKTAKPVQQIRRAEGGHLQKAQPRTTKPFQQIRPAEGGHLQKPQPRTAKPVLQNVPTKAGLKRKADDGDLSLTETPHQSKPAKHKHSVQPCKETGADCSSNSSALVSDRERSQQPQSGTTRSVQQIRPAEGGHLQKPRPGATKPVQKNLPTKAGLKRKADDGDLSLTETPHQSKRAKHENSVQSCKETGAVCPNNSSQQPQSGTADPVPQCLPDSQPATVPVNQNQQQIHPHPCTDTQTICQVKSGMKRKADAGDISTTETPHQPKRAKHEHSVQSCEEMVAVCPDASASVSGGRCPQQPQQSGATSPVPQYLPAVGGFQQQPQSVATPLVLQYLPAVGGCWQQPQSGRTVPVLQYLPAVGEFPQQLLHRIAVPVQQYWPAVGGFTQQCLYGTAIPIQEYWPAIGGCPQQLQLRTKIPVLQYQPIVGELQQHPLSSFLPAAVADNLDQQYPHPCT